jgi:hypothetical protein
MRIGLSPAYGLRFVALIGMFAVQAAWADFRAVHVGYVVPQDRTAQANAAANIAAEMSATQIWYEEQMDRWGFGPKTFRFEGPRAPASRSGPLVRFGFWFPRRISSSPTATSLAAPR